MEKDEVGVIGDCLDEENDGVEVTLDGSLGG